MRNITATAVLLSLLFVSGCTMRPDYVRPDFPVADNWRGGEELSKHTLAAKETLADKVAWQEFFISPGLQKVIETALANNRDLRLAMLNVKALRALYQIERSQLLPGVDAAGAGTRSKVTAAQSEGQVASGASREYIASTYTANLATTAFELDLFGRLRSQSEAALENYFETKAARDAARISLVAEVANTYLQWTASLKILALTQNTLAAQEKSYELMSKSYKNGVVSRLDLAQARQVVETARANLALYKRRVIQDENALVQLMGVKTLDADVRNERLDDVRLLNALPAGVPSQVLLARPDVRQAEHRLRSANANIGVARAAFFPSISLTGAFGYASRDLGNLFSGAAAGAWRFAPQVTMPIFQGGRNIATLNYAEVIKEASVAHYEKTVQRAFREVSDELVARSTLDHELTAQQGLVNAAQDAYNISQARYKQGVDRFLNVLDAQRSLFSAQQKEIEIQKGRLANLVNLYKVMGGTANVQKPQAEVF